MGIADYVILAAYFVAVLYVGVRLKRTILTGDDYFLSGRSLPSWITGLSYMAANLGSLELMGFVANGAKYGMFASQLYWIGSVPAMIFAGLVMVPFFYANRVKSVPEYLYRRYDEKTRTLNAIGFAVLTILTSGINLYGLAIVLNVLFGWPIHLSIFAAAGTVLFYVGWGGLTASIFNEVLQLLLIVVGLLPLTFYVLSAVGGVEALKQRLPAVMLHAWKPVLAPAGTPYGGGLFSVVVTIGFVAGFSYWSTDFLVMQRTFAARDLESAEKTPLIAACLKALFPFLTIVPGLAALLVIPRQMHGNFNLALPLLLVHFYPKGLLGIGVTAIVASFMSGMAGNLTALNTVWTYDLYHTYIAPGKSDRHYLLVGRVATVAGVALSIATAYFALRFEDMFDYWALLSSIFVGTGFATFLLGIVSERITGTGAFCGMVTGFMTAISNYVLYRAGVLHYGSLMQMDFMGGTAGFAANAITAWTVSLFGNPKQKSELQGLVYSLRPRRGSLGSVRWYRRPAFLAIVAAGVTVALNVVFW